MRLLKRPTPRLLSNKLSQAIAYACLSGLLVSCGGEQLESEGEGLIPAAVSPTPGPAVAIPVDGQTPTPTPSSSPTPFSSPSPAPAPAASPEPVATQTPAATPIPVSSPTPSSAPIPSPTPAAVAQDFGMLDRSYWLLSASSEEGDLNNAIDDDDTTRWSTGEVQEPGQWLSIDFGEMKTFNIVDLESEASPDDYPRGYEIYVSLDGVNWGEPIFYGEGNSATTSIEFDDVSASHLRIVQTSSVERLWWSIHELNVFWEENTSPTPTPVATPTPLSTPIITPSPLPTPAVTPTPVPLVTPTPVPVVTPTPVITPTPVVTPTPLPLPTPTPDPVFNLTDYEQGVLVYEANCEFCHKPITVSEQLGRSQFEITEAIRTNTFMQSISLTDEELRVLEYALNNTELPVTLKDVVPGYVIARRLNQVEYDNTVRDLFGFAAGYSPSQDYNFAQDGFRSGFNNNAAGLTLAPLDVENYLKAATGIVDDVFASSAMSSAVLVCSGDDDSLSTACLTSILDNILPRIYRRAVTDSDKSDLLGIAENTFLLGGGFTDQVKAMLINALLMPDFLFRMEPPPTLGDSHRSLTDYEIANRLSYFLWSSMPDAELFETAAAGSLSSEEDILAQVDRMLADSKSDTLAQQLTKQWFQTLALDEIFRDGELLDEDLKADIEQEVYMLVRDAVDGEITMQGLLNAPYTYLNSNLANHYGIDGSGLSDELVRYDFNAGDTQRGGLLRMASFLMINAHPENNSPVRRGKWVLERLLCSPPPPPPANIPSFEPEDDGEATGSLRTQTEAFFEGRDSCNACHNAMHGVGFAFEHYDENGRWQADDNSFAIDDSGELFSTGVSFVGVPGLVQAVTEDSRLASCVVEKTFAYAMGRDLLTSDYEVFGFYASQLGVDFNMKDLFKVVSTSPLMTQRSSEE